MDIWHPDATRVIPKHITGGSYSSQGHPKQVIHTIEGSGYFPTGENYYGHQNWPHSTITDDGIFQHIPLNQSARALRNLRDDPGETNRSKLTIQVEIIGYAAESEHFPLLPRWGHLVDWCSWVMEQIKHPLKLLPWTKQRVSREVFDSFTGLLGHINVPENTHWDPGYRFPWDKLVEELTIPTGDEEMDDKERTALYEVRDNLRWLKDQLEFPRQEPMNLRFLLDNTHFQVPKIGNAQIALLKEVLQKIDRLGTVEVGTVDWKQTLRELGNALAQVQWD